jgi:RimJ/RimL family protein N-acetyltransferase
MSIRDFYTRAVESERLFFRRATAADADAPVWFGIEPADAIAFADEHWQEHGFGPWVAVSKETGAVVAVVDLHYAGPGIEGVEADEYEVGWVVAVDARGAGIATEAGRAAIDYAFRELGADEVIAYTSPGNAASLRVIDKLGMELRGEGRSRDGRRAVIFVARRARRPAAGC